MSWLGRLFKKPEPPKRGTSFEGNTEMWEQMARHDEANRAAERAREEELEALWQRSNEQEPEAAPPAIVPNAVAADAGGAVANKPLLPQVVYIYMMRHAQSVANIAKEQRRYLDQKLMQDPPLSEEGIAKARARGAELAALARDGYLEGTNQVLQNNGLVVFGASVLLRAQQTALLVSKEMAEAYLVPAGAGAGAGPAAVAAMNSPAATYRQKLRDASNRVFVFPHIRETGMIGYDNTPSPNQNKKLNATNRTRRKNLRASALRGSESDVTLFLQWFGLNRNALYGDLDPRRLTNRAGPIQLFLVTHSNIMAAFLKKMGRTGKFDNLEGIELKVTYSPTGEIVGEPTILYNEVHVPSPRFDVLDNALSLATADLVAHQEIKPWEFYNARIRPIVDEETIPALKEALKNIKRPLKPSMFNFSSASRNTGRTQLLANVQRLRGRLRKTQRGGQRRSSKGTRRR